MNMKSSTVFLKVRTVTVRDSRLAWFSARLGMSITGWGCELHSSSAGQLQYTTFALFI